MMELKSSRVQIRLCSVRTASDEKWQMQRLQKNFFAMMFADAAGEARKLLDPREMLIEVEEIDFWFLLWTAGDEVWIWFESIFIVETKYVKPEFELLFELWDLCGLNGIVQFIESVFGEIVSILIRTFSVSSDWVKCCADRITKTSVIRVADIDNRLFPCEFSGQRLVSGCGEWCVFGDCVVE